MMGVVYRVFPDESQKDLINKTFGCVRKVYNFFLNGRNIQYDALGEYFEYNQCCNYLTTYKKDNPYLKEVDSTALQSALKHLEYTFQNKIKGLTGDIKFKVVKILCKVIPAKTITIVYVLKRMVSGYLK